MAHFPQVGYEPWALGGQITHSNIVSGVLHNALSIGTNGGRLFPSVQKLDPPIAQSAAPITQPSSPLESAHLS